ncbi:MAG: hypothetical protein HQK83_00820 [Fibrobacteria bacterium]|nr:hypothetical protein [Fibrobacteria bacterium]
MMTNTINDKITKLAEGVSGSSDLDVVEVRFNKLKNREHIQVFVAKANGVSIVECSKVSRELENLIEAEGLVQSQYVLEVSSPGLDRPLKTIKDFQRNIGRVLNITYIPETETKKVKPQKVAGVLKEINHDHITIESDTQTLTLSIDIIKEAKIKIQL